MNPQPVTVQLPAYVGERHGRRVAFVPCDQKGTWHEVQLSADVKPGDWIRVGYCRHVARISPEPFRWGWRYRAGGITNLISPAFARDTIRPSWWDIDEEP